MIDAELSGELAQHLNPRQREAVEHGAGPLLIFAGAGSGKTRAITFRIAHLIADCGVSPDAIMAVTFTNKAAGEMKSRVRDLLGPVAERVQLGTFHATCARILRRHADRLGYTERFTIYDQTDQRSAIKRVLKAMQIAERDMPPGQVGAYLDRCKNEGHDPATPRSEMGKHKLLAEVSAVYAEWLREADALDFGDLLVEAVKLFSGHEDVLERYRARWQHLLVDEFQDTNRVQYRLLRLLAGERKNLVVVGDDDQSIYGWRGADLRNVLDFEKDFPGARVVTLDQNYRSTSTILSFSGDLIAHNEGRKKKRLWTENEEGAPVVYRRLPSDRDEAEFVAATMRERVEAGESLGECAVFYRTNAQSRVLEEVLRGYRIPHVVVGSVRFFERAEIRDALAYLRVLHNPADSVALRRILNVPPRGIGKTTLTRAEDLGAREGLTLAGALQSAVERGIVGAGPGRKVQGFFELLRKLSRCAEDSDVADTLRAVLAETGMIAHYEKLETVEADSRIENLQELLHAAYEHVSVGGEPSVQGFLEQVALSSDIDETEIEGEAAVLMTLHLAKGLEFDNVFIVGLEEGLFPHSRSLDEPEAVEEERRLCYVGMTRARQRLFLCNAMRRSGFGGFRMNHESRFLFELPRERLDISVGIPGGASFPARRPSRPKPGPPSGEVYVDVSESQLQLSDAGTEGMTVEHPTFGPGRVLSVSGSGPDARVTVRFERAGTKKILARFLFPR